MNYVIYTLFPQNYILSLVMLTLEISVYLHITEDAFNSDNFIISVLQVKILLHLLVQALPFVLSYQVDHQSDLAVALGHVSFSTTTSLCFIKIRKQHQTRHRDRCHLYGIYDKVLFYLLFLALFQ